MSARLMCPEHTEVPCPVDCPTIRAWRLLVEDYATFWSDRKNGHLPWNKRLHGFTAHRTARAA